MKKKYRLLVLFIFSISSTSVLCAQDFRPKYYYLDAGMHMGSTNIYGYRRGVGTFSGPFSPQGLSVTHTVANDHYYIKLLGYFLAGDVGDASYYNAGLIAGLCRPSRYHLMTYGVGLGFQNVEGVEPTSNWNNRPQYKTVGLSSEFAVHFLPIQFASVSAHVNLDVNIHAVAIAAGVRVGLGYYPRSKKQHREDK